IDRSSAVWGGGAPPGPFGGLSVVPREAGRGHMMSRKGLRDLAALAVALAAVQGGAAWAQYGRYMYPRGYGGYGWGGWGGGETVQGSIARGMGAYAAGAGYYNQQTAVANS